MDTFTKDAASAKSKSSTSPTTSTASSSKGQASSKIVKGASTLKVTVYWGDVFYDTVLCGPEHEISIGSNPTNDIVVPLDGHFRRSELKLITMTKAGTVDLLIDESIEGHVYLGESYCRLSAAIEQKKAVPELDGLYRLTLNRNDRGSLVIGHLSFVLEWVHERVVLPRDMGEEGRRKLRIGAYMTVLVVGIILLMNLFQPHHETPPERIVEIISKLPAAPPPQPKQRAKAAVGERKTADGGAAKGDPGKATLSPKAQLSEAEKLRQSLGTTDLLGKDLTEVGTRAPEVARRKAGKDEAVAAAIEQEGNGGMSTIGMGKGAGGKTVGIGRAVGNGEGGFGGTGRLGLSGNSAVEGGTGHGKYETVTEGGLDRDVIDSIVRKRKDRIRLCYERQLNFKSDLAGKITVHFVIGASGQVLEATIAEDTMKNAAVNACVVSEAKTWQFPHPKGGTTVNVDYPFVFESSVKQ